jgi:hypothetical protein
MLTLMERNRERSISKRCSSVNQLFSRVWDPIVRVVTGVCVKFDFEHGSDGPRKMSSHCRNAAEIDPVPHQKKSASGNGVLSNVCEASGSFRPILERLDWGVNREEVFSTAVFFHQAQALPANRPKDL